MRGCRFVGITQKHSDVTAAGFPAGGGLLAGQRGGSRWSSSGSPLGVVPSQSYLWHAAFPTKDAFDDFEEEQLLAEGNGEVSLPVDDAGRRATSAGCLTFNSDQSLSWGDSTARSSVSLTGSVHSMYASLDDATLCSLRSSVCTHEGPSAPPAEQSTALFASARTTEAGVATEPADAMEGDEDGPFLPREFHPLDVQLARMLAAVSHTISASPAQLLQVLLNFAPEDYQDLVNALVESGCSCVHLLACHLHNLRTMAEEAADGCTDEDGDNMAAATGSGSGSVGEQEGTSSAAESHSASHGGATNAGAAVTRSTAVPATTTGPAGRIPGNSDADADAKVARDAVRESIMTQHRLVLCRLVHTALEMVQSNSLPSHCFPSRSTPPYLMSPPPPPPPPPRSSGNGPRSEQAGRQRAVAATAAGAAGAFSNPKPSSAPATPRGRTPSHTPSPVSRLGSTQPPKPQQQPQQAQQTAQPPDSSATRKPAATRTLTAAAPPPHPAGDGASAGTGAGSGAGTDARQLMDHMLHAVMQHLGPGAAAEVAEALTLHGLPTAAPGAPTSMASAKPSPPAKAPASALVRHNTVASAVLQGSAKTGQGLNPQARSLSFPSPLGSSASQGRAASAAGVASRQQAAQAPAQPYLGMGPQRPLPQDPAMLQVKPAAAAAPQLQPQPARMAAVQPRSFVSAPKGAHVAFNPVADERHLNAMLRQQQQQQQELQQHQLRQQQQLLELELLAAASGQAHTGMFGPAVPLPMALPNMPAAAAAVPQTIARPDPLALAAASQLLQSYGTALCGSSPWVQTLPAAMQRPAAMQPSFLGSAGTAMASPSQVLMKQQQQQLLFLQQQSLLQSSLFSAVATQGAPPTSHLPAVQYGGSVALPNVWAL